MLVQDYKEFNNNFLWILANNEYDRYVIKRGDLII